MSYKLELKTNDIVISNWQEGIIDDPYKGIFDMRNIDVVTIPGEASVALSTQVMQSQGAITTIAFTTNFNTNTFTYNGIVPLEVNTVITFTGADLPSGLVADTAYYILTVPTPTTFTVSAVSVGGTVKTFADNGTGVMTFSTINMGIPKFFTNYLLQSFRFYFMLDSNGRCWILNSSNFANTNKWIYMNNKSTEGSLDGGYGLQAYKGYLFLFTGNLIQVISIIDPITGFPSLAFLTTNIKWNRNWQIASTIGVPSNYTLIGQDDVLYFCNGSAVGSIFQVANPLASTFSQDFNIANTHTNATGETHSNNNINTTSAFFQQTDVGAVIVGTGIPVGTYIMQVTDSKNAVISQNATATASGLTFTITSAYTFNPTAVSIPTTDRALCLAELGQNLMIGGINNYIYPWDRVSVNFSFPIFLSEYRVSRMVTINTTMYIFAGFSGRIFVTNGANATPFFKIPEYLSNTTNPYIFWTDACFNRNQLYFSFYVTKNVGTTISLTGGLWAVDVDSVSPVSPRLQNQLSYGTYAGYASALCVNRKSMLSTLPSSDGYGLFIGWYDGVSTSGIDVGISTPYIAGQSYIECDPLPLGDFLEPRTLEHLQFKLGTPLVAGESVAFYYRKNIAEAYTLLPITQGNGVGDISGVAYSNFENTQWLQIKVVLTSTATNPSYVRLQSLRLH